MKLNLTTLPLAVLVIAAVVTGTYMMVFAYLTRSSNARVCVREDCFAVDIADNAEEREQGLMFRETLAAGEGMLFVFDANAAHSFWMKNTLIPLDIVWIDEDLQEDLQIAFIKHSAKPCPPANRLEPQGDWRAGSPDYCPTVTPPVEARYVLEVNAGTARNLRWEIGDSVTVP